MSIFKVVRIINSTSIEVSPQWVWEDQYHSVVNIKNFRAGDYDNDILKENHFNIFVKHKLKTLILNKSIELKNPTKDYEKGKIFMDVYLNDVNIFVYFPEFNEEPIKENIFTKIKNIICKFKK